MSLKCLCMEKFDFLKNCTPEQFRDFVCKLTEQGEVLTQGEALRLLEVFSSRYWDLNDLQSGCYEEVSNLFKNSPKETKMALIPELMKNSIICNDMVFLAQDLMFELSSNEQMSLDVKPGEWTTDYERTTISKAEFDYRQKNGLKCWIETENGTSLFCRPQSDEDGRTLSAMLNVLCLATC